MFTKMECVPQYNYQYSQLIWSSPELGTILIISFEFTNKQKNRSPKVLSHRTTKPKPKMPYHKDNYLSVSLSSQK